MLFTSQRVLAVCLLLQHINGLGDGRRDGNAHETGVFDDGDGLVAAERDHGGVADEAGAEDGVEAAGHQHHQQGGSLAAEPLPARPGFERTGLGLGAGVEHARHDQAGDVVHRHQDDQRLDGSIPAAKVRGHRPENKAEEGAEFVFHSPIPFSRPSGSCWGGCRCEPIRWCGWGVWRPSGSGRCRRG